MKCVIDLSNRLGFYSYSKRAISMLYKWACRAACEICLGGYGLLVNTSFIVLTEVEGVDYLLLCVSLKFVLRFS